MKEVTMYECEYCKKKVYRNKSSARRHEKKCFANPINKACRSCSNLNSLSKTVYNPNHGGNPGSTDYQVCYIFCTANWKVIDKYDSDAMNMQSNCPDYIEGKLNF